MTQSLAERSCPICESTSRRTLWSFDGLQYYTDRPDRQNIVDVETVVCRDCFAGYQNRVPTPTGFAVLFEKAAASYGSTDGRHAEQIDWLNDRNLLSDGTLVFDVGCYTGEFLAQLPLSVKRSGVDIDLSAIETAKQRDPNGRYVHSSFEELAIDDFLPEIITMFHVIEHVVRPREVLKRLLSISGKGTRLLLETPTFENARIGDINGFFSTQHLTHFSRNSLERLILSSGWVIEEWFEQPDYNGTRLLCSPGDPETSQALAPAPDISDVGMHYRYVAGWLDAVSVAADRVLRNLQWDHFVIWGAGMHTELAYALGVLPDRNNLLFIVDSDKSKQGHTWRGVDIRNPQEIVDCDWTRTGVLISSYGSQESAAEAALKLGVPEKNLVRIYETIHRY